ncbi:hypothetical protein C485_12623 [Natrinema altunense JCM 12890]|uniref:Uncharacterized protein n=1 Tax=Natrinema altunense (strain JCM 12890 / CGMCC 1.3731 / AJ2) TaxID=1227494 RepID=L9ZJK4_NATA2|nr:hypothetical protein C485_12623 [Natrinema altunense JCM 12890]
MSVQEGTVPARADPSLPARTAVAEDGTGVVSDGRLHSARTTSAAWRSVESPIPDRSRAHPTAAWVAAGVRRLEGFASDRSGDETRARRLGSGAPISSVTVPELAPAVEWRSTTSSELRRSDCLAGGRDADRRSVTETRPEPVRHSSRSPIRGDDARREKPVAVDPSDRVSVVDPPNLGVRSARRSPAGRPLALENARIGDSVGPTRPVVVALVLEPDR